MPGENAANHTAREQALERFRHAVVSDEFEHFLEFWQFASKNRVAIEDLFREVGAAPWMTCLTIVADNMTRVPPEIGCLTNLEELYIIDTPLTELPPEIGNLRSLKCLSLDNVPVPTLPPEISRLSELTTLEVDCIETFELPAAVGQLQKLRQLRVAGVSHLPDGLTQLSELEYLCLECRGSIALPPEIGRLQKLRCLDLRSDQQLLPEPSAETNVLQGQSTEEVIRRVNTQNLRIQREKQLSVALELPPDIGQLSELECLHVERMKLAKIPREIGRLKRLLELTLVCNELSALPAELGELRSLARLRVSHNRLTSLPDSIGQLSNLASLDVAHNRLDDLPRSVQNLPIRELELEGTSLAPQLIAEMTDAARDRFNSRPVGLRAASPVEAARAAARWSQTRTELGETLQPNSPVEQWRHHKNKSRTRSLIATAIVLVAGICVGVGAVLHLLD